MDFSPAKLGVCYKTILSDFQDVAQAHMPAAAQAHMPAATALLRLRRAKLG